MVKSCSGNLCSAPDCLLATDICKIFPVALSLSGAGFFRLDHIQSGFFHTVLQRFHHLRHMRGPIDPDTAEHRRFLPVFCRYDTGLYPGIRGCFYNGQYTFHPLELSAQPQFSRK